MTTATLEVPKTAPTTTAPALPATAHKPKPYTGPSADEVLAKRKQFVSSGSEANDWALLMARAYTGNYDVIALRNSYHGGNASGMSVTAHSTWKFNVPHSFGVHHAIAPDVYREPYGRSDAEAGKKY